MLKDKKRIALKVIEVGLTSILAVLLMVAFFQVAGSANLPPTFLAVQGNATVQYALIMDMELTAANDALIDGLKASAKDVGSVVTLYQVDGEKSLAQAFELASLTQCEGIFVKLRKNAGATNYIQKAVQSGMRVVVIDHDAPDSLRDAYIGANPVLVGKKAAEMAIKWAKPIQSQSVMVLLGASHQDATGIASSAYLNGFRQGVENALNPTNIEVVYTSELASEVIIENALKAGKVQIFVCTEPEDTIKAMNVLIDYNRIKEVVLIGSGNIPQVVDGVEKGLIEASIQVDYVAMGVEAMRLMTKLIGDNAPTAYQLMPINVIEGPDNAK